MSTKRDLLNKHWFLVSYNNLDTSLISGLRINRLHRFLAKKGVRGSLITRQTDNTLLSNVTTILEKKIICNNRRIFNAITPPDSSSFWAFSVFNYLRKKEPGVVFTTVPKFGVVFTGLLLWLFRTNHYWIVDFRDSWTFNPVYRPVLFWYKKIVSHILEYLVLKIADLVVINTFKDQEDFIKKYPFLKEKSLVVRNGFDQKIENQAQKIESKETIKIVYSGTAYHRGLAAINIADFLKKLNRAGLSISCDYYGEYHSSIDHCSFIEYKGQVLSEQVPEILSNYKLGLIYLQKECIGGGRVTQKFYDYIGSGVCPLVINPSREMSADMQTLNFGFEVYPNSAASDTIACIKSFYFSEQPVLDETKLLPFKRAYQFEKFYTTVSKSTLK